MMMMMMMMKVSTADGSTPPRGRRYRWTVLLSTDDRSPYPRLPADTRVRLVTEDCHSVTVAWQLPPARTSDSQRYCVYVEPVMTTTAEYNACTKPRRRRKSVKMSCHVTGSETVQVGERDGNDTAIQTISGMKPGRRYAVDVYVSSVSTAKKKELFLVYDKLMVHVRNTC